MAYKNDPYVVFMAVKPVWSLHGLYEPYVVFMA